MIFPYPLREVKRLRLGLVLIVLAVLFVFGEQETGSGLAEVLGCSQPAGQCMYFPLVSRTADPRVRVEALAMYQEMYLASETNITGWSGDVDTCNAGDISQPYRDAVLLRVNYFRMMAGVPQIKGFRSDYNQQTQAAALLMSANNEIRYDPPTGWTCYSQLASEGARYSNMISDKNGPVALNAYMRDDEDPAFAVPAVGHRRYLLFPQTQEMGNGDVPATSKMAVNAIRVIDNNYYNPRPVTRDEFVAWPPAAYVPYRVVPVLWSFSYAGADFSKATVTMEENGQSKSIAQYTPVNGYGENTLVWKAGNWGDWPNPGVDTTYTISVRNVLIGGQSRAFTYKVIVFDPGS